MYVYINTYTYVYMNTYTYICILFVQKNQNRNYDVKVFFLNMLNFIKINLFKCMLF